jgi:hypothetical protein
MALRGIAGIGVAVLGWWVLVSPARAVTAQRICTGTVQVTDTDNNTVIGDVSNVWNVYGEYVVTTTPANYLTVSFTPGTEQNITATNGPNAGYPLVVGIQGYYSSSADLSSGSSNYAYLGGGTPTAPGATPQTAPNSFTGATGISEAEESAIWTYGANNSLLPQWVNTDGSKPATYLQYSQSTLVVTGDPTVFQGTYGGSDVALNLVGSCQPVVDGSASGQSKNKASATITPQSGDLLVAMVAGDSPSNRGNSSTVSGGGLTWTKEGMENAQLGDAEVWVAQSSGTSPVTVTAKNKLSGYDETLTVLSVSGASGVGAVQTADAPTGAPTDTLTPLESGSLVLAVGDNWKDSTTVVPSAGQTVLHQTTDSVGDTYWVQEVGAPTVAGQPTTVSDTAPTTDPYDMVAVEIQ